MSSISNYYQLSALQLQQGSTNSTSLGLGTSGGSTSSTSTIQTLAAALDSIESGDQSSNSGAYSLNLSQAAQNLLNGVSTSGTSNTNTTSSTSSTSSSFTLTSAQKTEIENIVAKYKNAPLTQATFDEIQNDLNAAGLSPQKLSAQDQITSFNPTSALVNALGGNYLPINSVASQTNAEQSKSNNYLQSIIQLWQSDSKVAAASTTSSTATTPVTSSTSATSTTSTTSSASATSGTSTTVAA